MMTKEEVEKVLELRRRGMSFASAARILKRSPTTHFYNCVRAYEQTGELLTGKIFKEKDEAEKKVNELKDQIIANLDDGWSFNMAMVQAGLRGYKSYESVYARTIPEINEAYERRKKRR